MSILVVEKFVEKLWKTKKIKIPIPFSTNLEYYNGNLGIQVGGDRVNVEILWQNVLKEIKDELSSLAFDTWFSDVKLISLDNGVAIIEVPMSIHKKHLSDNCFEQIGRAHV